MFDTLTRMGASGAATSYSIDKSLRFNDEDSAYLHRTFSSDGNLKLFTYSFWFKFDVAVNADGALNSPPVFEAGYSGGGLSQGASGIRIDSGQLNIYHETNNSTDWSLKTSRLFRDPSAWYHLVMAFDTAQATEANRLKLWINGVLQTNFATSGRPSQNDDCKQNKANVRIGARDGSGNPYDYWEGYLAEWHVVDGAAKQATDFGEFDSDTGQWVPIKYTGTHGTNGYYLNFSDNSNTTSGTLGADSSANSNDFTPVNFSVSAGAGNDSFEDTPTNNWCTLNPGDTDVTLSNGNLVTNTSAGFKLARSTFWLTSGKWYFEVICDDTGNGFVGISGQDELLNNRGAMYDSNSFNIRTTNGNKYLGDGNDSSYGSAISDGDVVMVAVDCDAGKAWIGSEGTWFNSGDPAAGSNEGKSGITGAVSPSVSLYDNEDYTMNFGANMDFAHTPPTGFNKINTSNLSAPTIKKSTDHFVVKTYSGTGSTQTITTGLDADLVWVKRRNATQYHIISNTVVGHSSYLVPHETDAESDGGSQIINGFSSTGFQVGTESAVNNSSGTYVSWNWKESASAGFDIVTYTGNGSARTISHSLGVAPEMMIVKRRDGADNWMVYHKDNGNTHYVELNSAGGKIDNNTIWNDTTPTSSVFSVGTDGSVNLNTGTYINYLFTSVAGYCKVGKFVGNGSADGPFVYTGFKPAWVYSRGGSHNLIWHNKVEGYNPTKTALLANASNAEEALDGWSLDFYANGFKMRGTDANANENGTTFVYLAIAESPFKYSNAR